MVRKIPAGKRPVKPKTAGRPFRRFLAAVLFLTAAIFTIPMPVKAESPAAKNSEGNRLFAEGRYEEAEKSYLEAQVTSPGRPEILYNLGNALIKQAKYPQGIQALRQSADKGNERIQTDSLYNTGHALYSAGDYKGSAESFIEALKLDPSDRDAKYNLELALRKLKQQEQQQQEENRDQNKKGDQNEQQSEQNEGKKSAPDEQDRQRADTQNDRREQAKMKPEPAVPREGSISREQAQQILDAMRNQELDQQRRLMGSQPRPRTNERDW